MLTYLREIARVCTKLNLTIPWGLPSGLIVNQSYIATKEAKLRPFSYGKTSFTIQIPDKETTNKSKQVRAFMPNLVHSLDAASLTMLVDFYFNNYSSERKNIYTVHDCFAVTANNVDSLMELLKLVYIKLYSEDNYLIRLNTEIINYIKFHYGDDCFNSDTR